MIVVERSSNDDVVLNSPRRRALARFLTRAVKAVNLDGEVTVLLADDKRLRALNRLFRNKNKPTDVLSFPAEEPRSAIAGDIAISLETAARQAAEHGHDLHTELRILVLHGLLHLTGMDHETDGGEMVAREANLRARFKLPAGLIERTQPPAVRRSAVRHTTLRTKR